jgi:hypothetical protein
MTEMTGEALRRAGSRYLDRISSTAPNKERIVDKMPFNLLFIGLIYLALPNARVIHVRRDPLDTCFCIRIYSSGVSSLTPTISPSLGAIIAPMRG